MIATPADDADFEARSAFLALLARRLHEAGTSAPRLEVALTRAAERLGLTAEVWSSPTALILGTRDVADPRRKDHEVLRLNPGSINLRRLCRVDAIAEAVIRGDIDIAEGRAQLEQANQAQLSKRFQVETVMGYGLASTGVAGLLGGGPTEMAVAGGLSMLIGLLDLASGRRPQLGQALDAIAALLVAVVAGALAHYLLPMSSRVVLIASLIVLLPGLTLTTAASEIATGHLVSGTARMVGAIATLLKLAFGTLVGSQIVARLEWTALPVQPHALPVQPHALPGWAEWVCLAVAALSFAMLFRARLVDYPLAMSAAATSFLVSRFGSEQLGPEFGVFLAGFVINLAANFYATRFGRPGAVVRLPGIILLVPGSVGFRTLSFVFQKDVFLGLDTAVSLLLLLVSLVAGLLFANTLVPPRRAL
jgi:uncharacterized membrane protein YjjP (DUF1212 family)